MVLQVKALWVRSSEFGRTTILLSMWGFGWEQASLVVVGGGGELGLTFSRWFMSARGALEKDLGAVEDFHCRQLLGLVAVLGS